MTSADVVVVLVDPEHHDAQHCLREYEAELDQRLDAGFDVAGALPLAPDELRAPAGCFLVAYRRGAPVACGGLKVHGREPAEIKRVWVDPAARGQGLARRLIGELEARAREVGAPSVRLDTNRALTEALAMYGRLGYREVEPFNAEPYAHHWFQKDLPPHDGG